MGGGGGGEEKGGDGVRVHVRPRPRPVMGLDVLDEVDLEGDGVVAVWALVGLQREQFISNRFFRGARVKMYQVLAVECDVAGELGGVCEAGGTGGADVLLGLGRDGSLGLGGGGGLGGLADGGQGGGGGDGGVLIRVDDGVEGEGLAAVHGVVAAPAGPAQPRPVLHRVLLKQSRTSVRAFKTSN